MIKHITNLGAINKITNNYEYPSIASKSSTYKCPDCSRDVIFKKGQINRPHFAHFKSDSPCHRYDTPTESQIHKDGKQIIYHLLQKKTPIQIVNICQLCHSDKGNGKIEYSEESKPELEYKFKFENKTRIADVALIQDNKPTFIFEMLNTHRTKEADRPEPWYEIDAKQLISDMNTEPSYNSKGLLLLKCVREFKCKKCVIKHERIRLWKIEQNNKRHKWMMEKARCEQEQAIIQYKLIAEEKAKQRVIYEEQAKQRIIDDGLRAERILQDNIISEQNRIEYQKLLELKRIENKEIDIKRNQLGIKPQIPKHQAQIDELKLSMTKNCFCIDWFVCHSCVCINYEICKLSPLIPS